MNSELRAVLSMVLNALDRDCENGQLVRGEMAAELRAAMEIPPLPEQYRRFEAWHDEFYGPQDKFNPIRSTERGDEYGLSYLDPVVAAQFCAYRDAKGWK